MQSSIDDPQTLYEAAKVLRKLQGDIRLNAEAETWTKAHQVLYESLSENALFLDNIATLIAQTDSLEDLISGKRSNDA